MISVRRQLSSSDEDQCMECQAEHENEGLLLEDIGRLLGDVRASARSAALDLEPAGETLSKQSFFSQFTVPLVDRACCVKHCGYNYSPFTSHAPHVTSPLATACCEE